MKHFTATVSDRAKALLEQPDTARAIAQGMVRVMAGKTTSFTVENHRFSTIRPSVAKRSPVQGWLANLFRNSPRRPAS